MTQPTPRPLPPVSLAPPGPSGCGPEPGGRGSRSLCPSPLDLREGDRWSGQPGRDEAVTNMGSHPPLVLMRRDF